MKEVGKVMELTELRVSQLHIPTIFHVRASLQWL